MKTKKVKKMILQTKVTIHVGLAKNTKVKLKALTRYKLMRHIFAKKNN